MELKNTLLVVTDMSTAIEFYTKVLGLHVIMDLGANVTLTGGLSLQTRESWAEFLGIHPNELGWCGKVSEIYFEEDNFAAFVGKLNTLEIHYVHPVKEHGWGQRVIRFYDPDSHIIEVGESIKTVVHRFLNSGMTPEQVAVRMDVPLKLVHNCMRERGGDGIWKSS